MKHTSSVLHRRSTLTLIAGTLALAAAPVALAANPGTGRTRTGQQLSVRIDAPASGATVPLADLAVSGIAGVGTLGKGGTNLVYLVDKSGSTTSGSLDCNGDGRTDAGDDLNGDGSQGTILDCEVGGVAALNASLRGSGAQSGVIAFGSAADRADMNPAAGQQDFAGASDDVNANSRSDVEDVARSITSVGVGVFTPLTASGGGTDFNAAITALNATLAARAGQTNVAAFLSDGSSSVLTSAGSALDAARAAGTRINTYSVGSGAAGCAAGSSLRTIADTTGGACTEVSDPTKLQSTLAGIAAGLQGVQVKAGSASPVAATVTGLGTWSATVPRAALRSGSNTIVATVTATDGTTAAADVTVKVGGSSGGTLGSGTIGLPSSRTCTSKRLFPIQIRQRAGLTYDFATVVVNGRKVRVYVRTKRRWIRTGRPSGALLNVRVFKAYVDLRGLARGRYTVKIVVVATNGKVITGSRRYRTCTRRLSGSVPRL